MMIIERELVFFHCIDYSEKKVLSNTVNQCNLYGYIFIRREVSFEKVHRSNAPGQLQCYQI